MQDGVKFLTDKGITFSQGFYTTPDQINAKGLSRDGLMLLFYKSRGEYTLNDTPIPNSLIAERHFNSGPRGIARWGKEVVKKIYVDNKIEKLAEQSKLVDTGEKNIEEIMGGMTKGKIPVPKGYSVEGVALALKQGLGAASAFECYSKRDCLIIWKKEIEKFVTPETVDKVVAMDLAKIAKSWQYRAL
jgi:hypothetical protein